MTIVNVFGKIINSNPNKKTGMTLHKGCLTFVFPESCLNEAGFLKARLLRRFNGPLTKELVVELKSKYGVEIYIEPSQKGVA